MVATTKTWSDTVNNGFSSAVDQRIEYREAFYALKTQFLAANWVLEWSCNSLVASAADNLPNAAAVVWGLANGTQPISYFVMRAPSSTWGNCISDGPVRALVITDATTASVVPQNIAVYLSRSSYSLSGTPLTVRPVAALDETTTQSQPILSWGAAIAGSWSCWTTSDGDIYFFTKRNVDAFYSSAFMLVSPATADGTGGALNLYFFFQGAIGNRLTWNLIGGVGANSRGFWVSGAALSAATSLWSPAIAASLWTAGVLTSGEMLTTSVWAYGTTATNRRIHGRLVDVAGTSDTLPLSSTVTGDSDATRLASLGGGLCLPTLNAHLPLT